MKTNDQMKSIPISEADHIAKAYGYDQVIIIARKIDTPEKLGGEHVTTYGINKQHCKIAAGIGDFIKHRIMKWGG